MRIGEVSKDNYAAYIKLLGGKNTATLENMFGNDKSGKIKERTRAECDAAVIKAGYAEEGMLHAEGDTSWKKIVSVSDDIREKITSVAKRQFMSKSGGELYNAADGDEIGAIMKEYRSHLPANERASATWTLGQIVRDETARLANIVKSSDPTWEQGKPFDRNIFNDNYLNVRV